MQHKCVLVVGLMLAGTSPVLDLPLYVLEEKTVIASIHRSKGRRYVFAVVLSFQTCYLDK